ncbi:hypothetical protein G6045_21805 [Streptomyces sp. YC504]|uniref:Peptidase inhibitor family I36 protein n=1 Tax=Streptomyces mesophilus TaxID=1775132 RepID=A0A6G4XN84_9ACTN|nr:hypothetical protein [Streptomyces mesophilus]NGO78277.1 hypothetical protein [Streptomyces mesophilus]
MSSTIKRRIAAAGTLLVALGALGAGTASAQGTSPAALTCPSGYLCVQIPGQVLPTNIAPGLPYSFSKPVDLVTYTNNSDATFCVDADRNFAIVPGASGDGSVHTGAVRITTVPAADACPLLP